MTVAPPSPVTFADTAVARRAAMLIQGDEGYGIGTIIRLYTMGMPALSFVALGDGPMVDWLRAGGHSIDVVPGLTKLHEGGASIRTLLKMPSVFAEAGRNAAAIDALLRPRGIDIVHSHWRPQQIIGGMLRKRGYYSVWQINNTMDRGRLLGLGVKLNHRLAKWGADLLLPASDAIGDNWTGCGVRSITIRNAAEPLFVSANELRETPVHCLVAGRLEHSKGHHLAVEAVLAARRAGHDVRLDIYGGPLEDNAYADELRQKVNAAHCENEIRLMGFDPSLRQRHQEYHLGLQCRITPEPCSLWVCEALVDGLPLVASATGGTPELVDDGKTGLLFRGGDAADLSEKLLSLLRDPARLRAMRRAAFERGQRHFTLERFVRETLAAYESLPTISRR